MDKLLSEVTGEQLLADFKVVVADAEALIMATANQGDAKVTELRAKAEASLQVAKARMADMQAALLLKTGQVVKATDVYVHANPWQSMGAAAGLGLMVGFLLCRR
jgi:ElaB/YqjD/DUF883 family membrane-anchored ribosome-binding protein